MVKNKGIKIIITNSISKNITKIILEKEIGFFQKQFNDELIKWEYKIYHK